MRIDYVVHSSVVEDVPVLASIGGHQRRVMAPGLTVELVSKGEHGAHGHTFRFVPRDDADMAAHQALFTIGNAVSADFSATEAPQAAFGDHDPDALDHNELEHAATPSA